MTARVDELVTEYGPVQIRRRVITVQGNPTDVFDGVCTRCPWRNIGWLDSAALEAIAIGHQVEHEAEAAA